MRHAFLSILALAFGAVSAHGATLSKTYTYFPIRGLTLAELERQLERNGPRLDSTGQRHPGATNMEITTHVDYAEARGRCRVADARVTVKAKVTLPKWRDRHRADEEVRLIWDTLARDIRRHEESHMSIAKSHAHQLEDALRKLPWRRNCQALVKDVEQTTQRVLAKHDAAQYRFDRVENINFEKRIMRLLQYRLEQIETGRINR
ncbi:DUF922 domain-containing protein [Chelativorans sp. Marseille-P2723]|uniref:DUF922 domain-containing Zn-dependent protease n=1 Tax=Chelativorans sp. Marseille-P2723 TaxID=2709133 RepID=UPI00156FFB82|nr:DUF922 domain-containing protein [Chelativorans sp. Marseille-P2723]